MRTNIKLLVFLLMTLSASLQQYNKSVELLCNVENYVFIKNVEHRSCYVFGIPNNINENVTIRSMKCQYWDNNQYRYHSNDCDNNINGLVVDNKYIFYMPSGLQTFSSSILALAVKNSKLKKISSKDLEYFSRLELLDLSGNEIELLESNLFKGNRYLKYLNLNYNRIAMIETNGLSGLSNLISFEFWYNSCYSSGIQTSQYKENMEKFIGKVKTSCSLERIQSDIFANEKLNDILTTLAKLTSIVENLSLGNSTANESLTLQTTTQLHSRFHDSKYLLQNDDDFLDDTNKFHHQRTRFKQMIFILICAISLTYSLNVLIMYCLFPRNDNEHGPDEAE